MDRGLAKINKVVLISLAVLIVISLVIGFTLPVDVSTAVIIAATLTYISFAATLYSYYRISKSQSRSKAYILLIFFGKMIFIALVFFLIYMFSPYDLLAFIFSFLAFFIIFLNIEIFLLYKRIIFGTGSKGT